MSNADPTNDERNRAAADPVSIQNDTDGGSGSRNGSSDAPREDVDRDWAALARKLADEPTERDPNAGCGQCGPIPKTNEDVCSLMRFFLEQTLPWLRVRKGEPSMENSYLFVVTFTSDEQGSSGEASSTEIP
jgi:hypothetical protein